IFSAPTCVINRPRIPRMRSAACQPGAGSEARIPCQDFPMNGAMAASSNRIMLGPLVAAIDQGTSSTRFLVFNAKTAELLSHHQVEIQQSFPKEGKSVSYRCS
ncbi:hypothetical protein QTP86_024386, partial [Hemibagrus guttatus]